jgi:hypothetical protein
MIKNNQEIILTVNQRMKLKEQINLNFTQKNNQQIFIHV